MHKTNNKKLIQISNKTYEKLFLLGKYGDTFDSIISRLLPKSTPREKEGKVD